LRLSRRRNSAVSRVHDRPPEGALTHQLETPLGRDLKSRPGSSRAKLDGASVFALCAAVAVAAGSGFIAMQPDGLRVPVAEAPPVVEQAVAPPQPQQQVAAPQPVAPADGPSIIKVNPEPDQPSNGVVIIRDPSALARNPRTAHLPDKDLLEQSEAGALPVRAADGRRPFDVYSMPWSGSRGAKVAIVIGGLGLSQTGTQAAIKALPPEVTLGFASAGNSLSRWMQAGRQAGHEIVLQVPLEPFDYPRVDPGRNTLIVDAPAAENVKSLHWALGRTTNYVGVMNYMGGRFVTDQEAMTPFMAELGKRGLMYLDDGSSARSVAPAMALASSVPLAVADGAIDAQRDRGAIMKKLDELEATARARGSAVGTGSAFDETVDAVRAWVAEAKKRGIEIVPISALASDPEKGR
jgi:polysaccharide deacetylase 2 family uncharacterized protein YibQ